MQLPKFELLRDYFSTFFSNARKSLIINDLDQYAILEYQHFEPNKSHMQLACIRHILLYLQSFIDK